MTRTFLLLGVVLTLTMAAAAQQPDAAGCTDDPLFPTRMPHYRIERCEHKAFDSYEFYTVKPPKQAVEGELTFIQYAVDARENEPSAVEVVRNYENALRAAGATVRGSVPTWWVNGTVSVEGREVWAQAEKGNGKIWLRIVRPAAMAQVVVADATALGNGLRASGHTTVGGIYFDTGRAELKPESAQAVAEIARLLQTDKALKVWLVGHTDSSGTPESNLALSQSRADAVLQALVREHGIDPARLRSFGNGPFAPVATNDTDEGRARNRRVELVKQ